MNKSTETNATCHPQAEGATANGILKLLETYAQKRIDGKEKYGPIPRKLRLVLHVEGSSRAFRFESTLDPGMKHMPIQSSLILTEIDNAVKNIEKIYGIGNKILLEVVSDHGDKVLNIRVITAAEVEAALSGQSVEAPTATESGTVCTNGVSAAPAPSGHSNNVCEANTTRGPAQTAPTFTTPPTTPKKPKPVRKSLPKAISAPVGASNPASIYRSPDTADNTPIPIDYETMKLYPKDPIPAKIRLIFNAAGIGTKQELLKFLGTSMPSSDVWKNFLEKLDQIALEAKLPPDHNIETTIYFWLVKTGWIKSFVNPQKKTPQHQ